MSRIGKKIITIPDKVNFQYAEDQCRVKGPLGELFFKLPKGITLNLKKEPGKVFVEADFESSYGKKMGGTTSALIQNMLQGVTSGFEKHLELVGVGYRAQLKGNILTLNLGYSNPIEYSLPKEVSAKVDGNTKIILTSCDKQRLGQISSEIRAFRPPEPYKGKGIKFANEVISRKAGKAGKGAKK